MGIKRLDYVFTIFLQMYRGVTIMFLNTYWISLSLWPCISTRPLAKLSLRSSLPACQRADPARQIPALEACRIRTWLGPCQLLPSRLSRYNRENLLRFLSSWQLLSPCLACL